MIELAANHKVGLQIRNPVMIAGGIVGYGDTLPLGFDAASVGAIVIGPFAHYGHAGSEPPRLAHTAGGIILNTGSQRSSVRNVTRRLRQRFNALDSTLIAQIVDNSATHAASVARSIGRIEGIHGVELAPEVDNLDHLLAIIRSVNDNTDLPMLVKVSLSQAAAWARDLCEVATAGLVVGHPVKGAASRRSHGHSASGQPAVGPLLRGDFYGPALFPIMMEQLLRVLNLDLTCSIVAAGGIHSADDAQCALDSGAAAIQVDSAMWLEPGIATAIAESLA